MASSAAAAGHAVVSPTVETFDRIRTTATMRSVDIEDYFVLPLLYVSDKTVWTY